MQFVTRGGRHYAQFERLARVPGFVHAFTLRPEDVSARDDEWASVRAARRATALRDWHLPAEALRYTHQVHEPRLMVVHAETPPGPINRCDGLVTTLPGIPLMTFSADCPLVLLVDPGRRVVGMAHASWRCAVGGIVGRLVETMTTVCGCEPQALYAGVGPSAGPDAYEVRLDMYAAAADLPERERFFHRRNGGMYFDLWAVNVAQLEAAGVPRAHIEVAGLCTMSRTDLFYSFRREGRGCGHFGLLAAWAAPG
ncbi:MAG: laccase domain-containing protein [Phycisphaerales bacterium]|nr:laccase domain-containing protein [Phycisphaerales bacterium]